MGGDGCGQWDWKCHSLKQRNAIQNRPREHSRLAVTPHNIAHCQNIALINWPQRAHGIASSTLLCALCFLVAPCCSQGATLQVTLRCRLSGCLSLAIFFFQNFFSPKIIFTSKFCFPVSLFYAFLGVLCHPECSKKFSSKIFLDDTMLIKHF